MSSLRLVLLTVATAALAVGGLVSCNVNDYCVNCAISGDGGTDGQPILDGNTNDGNRTDGGTCVPTGNEVCDGKDNDCDGTVDNGVLPGVGDTCGNNVGECTVGLKECVSGVLKCSGVAATPEVCDNKDNDCNGTIDNGDPGGGAACGSNVGECVAGTNRCVNGAVTCVGSSGTPGAIADACDGKDNDCDGMTDEGLANMGSCGMSDVGECALGTLMCTGGVPVCMGDVGPSFELCDALDQDCDGNATNGFDLNTDARNCGNCGNICMAANATAACASGMCAVGACNQNYYNNDNDPANGCEYGPCTFEGPVEACNGKDDNCNGMIDDNMTAPNICRNVGACMGTVATCGGMTGWECVYGATVSTDANGDIIPETECDGIDNDCDGQVDEGDPDKGSACGDAMQGICRSTGVRVCDPVDKNAPTICEITVMGQPPAMEACNGKDDDCDGTVDNGANTGNLIGQEWVSLGGVQIMKYEASKPDATNTEAGATTTTTCSRAGVQPWVNITAPQAAAACTAIGAHLCTEQEWHRSCGVVPGTAYPVNGPPGTAVADRVFIEAENYFSISAATAGSVTRAWTPDVTAGYSGASALKASPDTGVNVSLANGPTQAPRVSYQFNFTSTGDYTVWVRMYSAVSAADTIGIGIATNTTTAPTQTLQTPTNGGWVWVKAGTLINVPAIGNRFLNVFMREDGVKIDQVMISKENSTTAPTLTTGNGGIWAYGTSPNVASDTNCNAQPLDTDGVVAGNQDDVLPTGALNNCYANGSAVNRAFDMSGNVREWTAARQPGNNPIRGGASNAPVNGTTCALDFTLANDTFFFPNVGFRCCR